MEKMKCPECGSTAIGKGVQQNYAAMIPVGGVWGSELIADICTDCGLVIKVKVRKPSKFKKSIPK